MNQNIQDIKKIIEDELEQDFSMGRLRPYSRIKHLKEHIFWKIDNLIEEQKTNL
jgi:hypothetical protein